LGYERAYARSYPKSGYPPRKFPKSRCYAVEWEKPRDLRKKASGNSGCYHFACTCGAAQASTSLSFRALARNLLHDEAQISPRGVYPAVSLPSGPRGGAGTGAALVPHSGCGIVGAGGLTPSRGGRPACLRPGSLARRNDKYKKVRTRKPQFSDSH
jgi:hypothetical protein